MDTGFLAAMRVKLEPLLAETGQLICVETCGSTNDLARDYVLAEQAEPIVVAVTAEQSGGKGRRGRQWFQQPGKDIACSLGFELEHYQYALSTRFSLVAGVLISHAVEKTCGLRINLKWPNDLIAEGKKTGGILVISSRGYVITGIGVNVNSHLEEFPAEVSERATSLCTVLRREVALPELVAEILHEFMAFFEESGRAEASLMDEWVERSVTVGRRITIDLGDAVRELNALDINRQTGELICEDDEGNRLSVSLGEVMD